METGTYPRCYPDPLVQNTIFLDYVFWIPLPLLSLSITIYLKVVSAFISTNTHLRHPRYVRETHNMT